MSKRHRERERERQRVRTIEWGLRRGRFSVSVQGNNVFPTSNRALLFLRAKHSRGHRERERERLEREREPVKKLFVGRRSVLAPQKQKTQPTQQNVGRVREHCPSYVTEHTPELYQSIRFSKRSPSACPHPSTCH